jgi:hypothetical protein
MSARYAILVILCLGLAAGGRSVPYDNDLALTPPMGWNSWNHFGCDVSVQLVKETSSGSKRTRAARRVTAGPARTASRSWTCCTPS